MKFQENQIWLERWYIINEIGLIGSQLALARKQIENSSAN